jgi:hypothetical protein
MIQSSTNANGLNNVTLALVRTNANGYPQRVAEDDVAVVVVDTTLYCMNIGMNALVIGVAS